jgi:ABC-type bacteriocin/lantibiotic exporter with double-glycine peptidase domain
MIRATAALLLLVWFCPLTRATDSSGVWLDVPFVKQRKDECGAASVAMILQYWLRQLGRPTDQAVDVDQIQRTLYSRAAHGIFASQMQSYFQEHGFRAFAFRGSWDDLNQHLAQGRPLIVALQPSSGKASLHYLVVAGLDGESGTVLVNDPAQRKLLKQDRASFEREWSATDRWTLLALPQLDNR